MAEEKTKYCPLMRAEADGEIGPMRCQKESCQWWIPEYTTKRDLVYDCAINILAWKGEKLKS